MFELKQMHDGRYINRNYVMGIIAEDEAVTVDLAGNDRLSYIFPLSKFRKIIPNNESATVNHLIERIALDLL